MPDPQTTITGLYAVGVPVRDQDRALDFYVDRLGLHKRRDVPSDELGGRWIEVAPEHAPVTIALLPERAGLQSGRETGIRLTTPDAHATRERWRREGLDVGPVGGCAAAPPTFVLRDPDGNELMIVEERPRIPAEHGLRS